MINNMYLQIVYNIFICSDDVRTTKHNMGA